MMETLRIAFVAAVFAFVQMCFATDAEACADDLCSKRLAEFHACELVKYAVCVVHRAAAEKACEVEK